MSAIKLEVNIDATVEAISAAIGTPEAIKAWWTDEAALDGDTLVLGFPGVPAPFRLAVDGLRWTSVGEIPPNWKGTTITWTLIEGEQGPHGETGIRVCFAHEGLAADDPSLGSVDYTWAQLLRLLKDYVEHGIEAPLFVRHERHPAALTVIATATAKPGEGDKLEAVLRASVVPTHAEPGNLHFSLHRGADAPETVIAIERWSSPEALQAHFGTDHIATVMAQTADLMAGAPDIRVLAQVPEGTSPKGRF